jgi:hypothetical protein
MYVQTHHEISFGHRVVKIINGFGPAIEIRIGISIGGIQFIPEIIYLTDPFQ